MKYGVGVFFLILSFGVFCENKNLIHYLSMHSLDAVYKSDKVVGIRYKDYKKPLGPHRRYFAIMRDSRKDRPIEFYLASPPKHILHAATQPVNSIQNSQFQANQLMVQAQEALMRSIVSDDSSGGGSFFESGSGQGLSNDWNETNEMDRLLKSFSENTTNQKNIKQYLRINNTIHYWDGDVVKSGKAWYTISDGNHFFIALDNGFFIEPKIK